MDRTLKTIPDNLFNNTLGWYDKVTCGQLVQVTYAAPIVSLQTSASVLKTGFSEDKKILCIWCKFSQNILSASFTILND